MQKELIGVDIGGTNMKAGRVIDGSVVQSLLVEVSRGDSAQATLSKLFYTMDMVMTDRVEGIGIGVPAVVDLRSGMVYDVQNIPAWTKIALKDLVFQRYGVPVHINNDANCFALGEKYFGKAQRYGNCVALSLGTGLGMGVLIDNYLYNGVLCGAGEIGMVPYKEGIMEQYTGSFFFEEQFGESAKSLYGKAMEGDPRALSAFGEYGMHLGEAIKTILYMYAPEAIILGGSISKAHAFFEEALLGALRSFAYQKQLEHFTIETSDLVDSPILGAVALCLQNE